jgi:hypothetical protein
MKPKRGGRDDLWSDFERQQVALCAMGAISVPEMVDSIPGRTVKSIRLKYAWAGDPPPDEDERYRRACTVSCYALEKAMKAMLERRRVAAER